MTRARRRLLWRRPEETSEILVESPDGRHVQVTVRGQTIDLDCVRLADGRRSVLLPSGRQLSGRVRATPVGDVLATVGARRLEIPISDPVKDIPAAAATPSEGVSDIRAQIPGRVVEVRVAAGEAVEIGAPLLVIEAMKMQNEIRAPFAGSVVRVEVLVGQAVEGGSLLLSLRSNPGN